MKNKDNMQPRTVPLTVLIFIVLLGAPLLRSQNLYGSVVADDTSLPIGGATVVAIGKQPAPGQDPSIYRALLDSNGKYSLTLPSGQYQLCVHDTGLYLNPCSWGGAAVVNVTASTLISAPLRLKKGAWFIVRMHDPQGYLAKSEVVPHSGIAAMVSGTGIKPFPLPVVYENGRIRDYGAVVPANVSLNYAVSGNSTLLADKNGAVSSAQGATVQVTGADPASSAWLPRSFLRIFPPITATVVHYHVTGAK